MLNTAHYRRGISAFGLMLLHAAPNANTACMLDPIVEKRVKESLAIDKCFVDGGRSKCLLDKLNVEEQRELNAERLIPLDRSADALMNTAAGAVEVTFPYGRATASGQKISRCHVVTAAHILYKDIRSPVEAFDEINSPATEAHQIKFRIEQTCDEQLFGRSSKATVRFRMTKSKIDFICDRMDNYDNCLERRFYGKSDLVILRLAEYDKSDNRFFGIDLNSKVKGIGGEWINCWGYPGYNNQLSWIPKKLSDQLLWFQKSAKIFPGNYDRGILTNAIAYPGMSGGGCARQSNPDKIFALLTQKNSLTGHAGLLITEKNADELSANFASPFEYLSQRFKAATGKDLQRLDEECD